MKKWILVVFVLVLIIVVWMKFFLPVDTKATIVGDDEFADQPLIGVSINDVQKEEIDVGNTLITDQTSNNEINNCEELNKEYPELEQKLNDLLGDIYMNVEQATSSDVYSHMDERSLSALAYGGDKEAQFIHGTNFIWQGAAGIRIFRNDRYEKPPSNEQIKLHQIDFELIEKGEDLLYKSALRVSIGN